MRSLMIFFSLVFLVMPSSIALGFHDSMPKEIYAELQEYGITFIEYDGLVLRKDGCPNVRRTLLKNGPISKSRGMALERSARSSARNQQFPRVYGQDLPCTL